MLEQIGKAVGEASNPRAAKSAIARVCRSFRESREIAEPLFISSVMGDLAGQLMVDLYEVPHGAASLKLSIGEAQEENAFLSLHWQDAIDYFRERGLMRERELARLVKDKAAESAAAREAVLKAVQERTYAALDTVIAEGQSFRDFSKAIAANDPREPMSVADRAYLETAVFRTNVMDAYGAGRQRALSNPIVVAARPYRALRNAGDTRVRAEHNIVLVWMADGPMANLRSPFGYGCRCACIALKEWDGEVAEEVPPTLLTPGFGGM